MGLYASIIFEPPSYRSSSIASYWKGRRGEEKRKKVIVKVFRKAHLGGSNDDNDDLGEDPFSDSKIIQDLTDKFTMFEVVDQMADLDHAQHIWDFLRTIPKVTKYLPISKWCIV
ncbi:hypothetical protein COCNU_scaffold000119G000030 [Cocos nucifera]|nr:hypothetical protein [Cocos nucifera]